MRRLTCSALLALAFCVASALPAASAPPTVGGKGAASVSFGFTTTGPQQHVLAETVGNSPADAAVVDTCAMPRCYAFPFAVAAPTKTLKSVRVSAQITWTSPAARFWLHVMDLTKFPERVASCYSFYGSAGPSATVETSLKTGRKYAIWVTVQTVLGTTEAVKGVVHSPATDKPHVSPLSGADRTGLFVNSCQG